MARCAALLLGACASASTGERGDEALESPWTAAEQRAADEAVRRGFRELVDWVDREPRAAADLGENAVECFLDISYGATDPDLRAEARAQARALLDGLVMPQRQRELESVTADELLSLLTLANYERQLADSGEPATLTHLVELAGAAAAKPGALAASLGVDPDAVLGDPGAANDDVYGLLMGSIVLVEASLLPGLELPSAARELPRRLWSYLATYPLVDAAAYPERGNDWTFYDTAYLATHIGYLPTGYGRHALPESDAPWLHEFLRRNFDDVLAMGELDLVAEFVDLFRQYGGDEASDPMIRRGSRHLLRLFDAAGGSFMAHRESYETDQPDAYDLIHKVWTGIAGLRRRQPVASTPGTYGAAFDRLVRSSRSPR